MSKKSFEKFDSRIMQLSDILPKNLMSYLKSIQLAIKREGTRNANNDFAGPTTRSGLIRDYPLTGRLKNSVNAEIIGDSDGVRVRATAGLGKSGVPLVYALPLEYGNVSGTIKPFFFMGRAVQKVRDEELDDELNRFLRIQLESL